MKKNDQNTPYLFMMGAVALVAIIALILNGGPSLDGAVATHQEILPNEEYQKFCTDEEPDNDYYKAGTATLRNKKYHDYCKGDFLYQFSCRSSNSVRVTPPFECPNGCLKGACLR